MCNFSFAFTRIRVIILSMSKTKKLFLALMIITIVLFLGCGASIIISFVNEFDTSSASVLALVYLFLHLIVLALVFYLSFKAFYTDKSSLLAVFSLDEKGNLISRTKVVAIVVASLFFIIGIYFTLELLISNMPLTFFTKTLKFALMNVGYSVGIVALFFILFPIVTREE